MQSSAPSYPKQQQRDYADWHHRLGHLSHAHFQELAKQGKISKHFQSCTPPDCPACLFAKQTNGNGIKNHKDSHSHSLRALATHQPGSFAFTDQMVSSTPGLIPQSTRSLTKHILCSHYIFG